MTSPTHKELRETAERRRRLSVEHLGQGEEYEMPLLPSAVLSLLDEIERLRDDRPLTHWACGHDNHGMCLFCGGKAKEQLREAREAVGVLRGALTLLSFGDWSAVSGAATASEFIAEIASNPLVKKVLNEET